MEKATIEARVTRLEKQVAGILANGIAPTRNWRDVVQKYEGDEGLLEIFREAMKLREADRRKARREFARKRRVKSQ